MIKRIIGVVATLVILAVVVFAALNYNNYKSMLFERSLYEMLFVRTTTEQPAENEVTEDEPAIENEEVIEIAEDISAVEEGVI